MILLPALPLIAVVLLGSPAAEKASKAEITVSEPKVTSNIERRLGGVVAPATLPAGATSLYAILGAPELGAGFRQGFGVLELEAKLMFNYLLASSWLEAGFRFRLYERDLIQMAPTVALGLEANSGARYFDRANFAYVALRPRVGLVTSLKFSDTVAGVLSFDLPWSIALTAQGSHVVPTLGAGAEVHLGGNISGLLMAQVGLDAIKEPLGVTQYRIGWAIRLGLGFRLF